MGSIAETQAKRGTDCMLTCKVLSATRTTIKQHDDKTTRCAHFIFITIFIVYICGAQLYRTANSFLFFDLLFFNDGIDAERFNPYFPSIIFCLMVLNTNAPAPRVIIILTIFTPAPNGNGCVNNSTKSSIIRPRDKGFYKKRNGNLKRKLVVRLVKKDRSLRLQVWVVRKILKLSCIFIILT